MRRFSFQLSRVLGLWSCLAISIVFTPGVDGGTLIREEFANIEKLQLRVSAPNLGWEEGVPGFDRDKFEKDFSKLADLAAERCGIEWSSEAPLALWLMVESITRVDERLVISVSANLREPAQLERRWKSGTGPQPAVDVTSWEEEVAWALRPEEALGETHRMMWFLMTSFFEEVESSRSFADPGPLREDCLNPPSFSEDLKRSQQQQMEEDG